MTETVALTLILSLVLALGGALWAWRRAGLRAQDARLAQAAAEAQLKAEREAYQAREGWLRDSEARLTAQFDRLSQKLMADGTEALEKRQQQTLGQLLNPLKEQISTFREKIEAVQLADAKDKASLLTEIRALQQATQGMNAEAKQLSEALRGDKKLQGNWGELILDRVLEASGLRAGHEYEKQQSLRDETGRLKRPDVIVHLPEGRDVVIDAKVTLVAWDAARAAPTAEAEAIHLARHAQDLRAQLQRLASQGYAELEGLASPDFVLLFVPIEAALAAALEQDPSLLTRGFEQRVILVGPTTLLLALRVVEMSWRRERQHQKAEEIARRAGALHDKIQGTVTEMEKVGRQIATLERTWETAMGRLATGRGSVLTQAKQFMALGGGAGTDAEGGPEPPANQQEDQK